jgi:hypothetical protein
MYKQVIHTLEDVAGRNPAVSAQRVRQMQDYVRRLEGQGILRPAKYEVESALGGPVGGRAKSQHGTSLTRLVSIYAQADR